MLEINSASWEGWRVGRGRLVEEGEEVVKEERERKLGGN